MSKKSGDGRDFEIAAKVLRLKHENLSITQIANAIFADTHTLAKKDELVNEISTVKRIIRKSKKVFTDNPPNETLRYLAKKYESELNCILAAELDSSRTIEEYKSIAKDVYLSMVDLDGDGRARPMTSQEIFAFFEAIDTNTQTYLGKKRED